MPNDYRSGGNHTTGRYQPRTMSEYDSVSANIPIWRDWSGAAAREAQDADNRASDENRAYWDSLNAPTADQLTAEYNYDPSSQQAQQAALDQMAGWAQGGLTSTDRRSMDSTREADAQGARAQRDALMQQAQARGVGGNGLDFASQQMANQSAQQASSARESQQMAAAQQRALQAAQASGQMATQMRQQGQHEVEQRAQAPVAGVQGAFDAASTRAAGATGQYGTDAAGRQSARDRQKQTDTGLLSFLGEIL